MTLKIFKEKKRQLCFYLTRSLVTCALGVLFSVPMVLPLLECHIHGISRRVVWFLLFSILLLRFIHVAVCNCSWVLFTSEMFC